LRWIVQQPGVTTVIPGARDVNQVLSNTAAADNPGCRSRRWQQSRTFTTGASARRSRTAGDQGGLTSPSL
jgi:predicted aldo/keto reductase-like oxidoreductase